MLLKIGGLYEHVKTGGRYKIIALAKDCKSLEDLVIYENIKRDNPVSNIWVRKKESFLGEAKTPEGTTHPRFKAVEE